jgi:hypothetical protein
VEGAQTIAQKIMRQQSIAADPVREGILFCSPETMLAEVYTGFMRREFKL